MKTIFNTYIEVESQEQANRLKQVCIDNGLPYWDTKRGFIYSPERDYNTFEFFNDFFWVCKFEPQLNQSKATETEWMELLKQHNEKD